MASTAQLAEIAALVGDPARANMLNALMDGRALPASELAYFAGVSAPTASGHLAKLVAANLLAVEQHGRWRYYRLATPLVGRMLEGIMAVAAASPARHRPVSRIDAQLRAARTCYDHLAGRLGVGLADAMVAQGHAVLEDGGGEITATGHAHLADLGVDMQVKGKSRRVFCRPCLDWSERRPHLAGTVGAALATRCFELGWIARLPDTRAVAITDAGRAGFAASFGFVPG